MRPVAFRGRRWTMSCLAVPSRLSLGPRASAVATGSQVRAHRPQAGQCVSPHRLLLRHGPAAPAPFASPPCSALAAGRHLCVRWRAPPPPSVAGHSVTEGGRGPMPARHGPCGTGVRPRARSAGPGHGRQRWRRGHGRRAICANPSDHGPHGFDSCHGHTTRTCRTSSRRVIRSPWPLASSYLAHEMVAFAHQLTDSQSDTRQAPPSAP
jgi:hypothetical protein